MGRARPRGPGGLAPRAEVEAAGQLADDQHVDAVEQLRPERRGRHERRVDAHRAEVGEQPEAAAQGEERLFGANGRFRVVPFRPTHRAEEDRVAVGAGGQVLGPDGDAVGVDRGPADDDVMPPDGKSEARPGRGQDAFRRGDDVRPDAVARDRDQPVAGKVALPGHGRRSDGPSAGSDARSRSAARSLFAATT